MRISPGDMVVCVDAGLSRSGRPSGGLELNRIYTIADYFIHPTTGEPGVLLREIVFVPCLHHELGWRADRFRPVRKTDISVFTDLLQRVDA